MPKQSLVVILQFCTLRRARVSSHCARLLFPGFKIVLRLEIEEKFKLYINNKMR